MLAALEIARSIRGRNRRDDHRDLPDFGDRYLSTNLWIGWQKLGPLEPRP